MSITESLDIRPYQEGDETKILELFTLSYGGREMSMPYWRWRFQDNPSGQGVIYLVWDNDILAAHYAVTTVSMRIGGQESLAGLSGTTMTHPKYRGHGLFPLIASRVYEEMIECGMTMVWGFPNTTSHRGFICDLGWSDIYEIPMFRLMIKTHKIPPTESKRKIYELTEADDRFNFLWEKAQDDYDICIYRRRNYINWRYFANPIEQYDLIAYFDNDEIKGYAVFKRYQDELQVVDLLIKKNDVEIGKCLIEFIILKAIDVKANSISLWMNVVHPLHHALEKMGFQPEGPVTYLGGLVLNRRKDKSIYDFRRWYFTMSDSDVF